MQHEESRTVGVVIEKRPSASRWVDYVWRVVDVLDGAAEAEPFSPLGATEDGRQRYFAGSAEIVLHRKETEAYRVNLQADRALYVVLRNDPSGTVPFIVQAVTASAHEACDYLDSGEETVEPVPMAPAILEWVEAFYAAHHREEPFIKRKRDRVDPERLQFSKEPIFARTGRFPDAGFGGPEEDGR